MKTAGNKLCAMALLLIGFVGVILEKDITLLVFMSCIGVPLLFAKEDWLS